MFLKNGFKICWRRILKNLVHSFWRRRRDWNQKCPGMVSVRMGSRKRFGFVMIHCITLEMTVIAACAKLVCSVG
jgi:hypothetical protein